MRERVARAIVLMRAIEEHDTQREVLSDDDRKYASRAARELAHWEAAERKSPATFALFLQQRAEQVLKRLAQRHPAFAPVARGGGGLWAYSWWLPVLALLVGAAIDRFTDPHDVDLLAAPLLAIILWNLLVYLLVLASLPLRKPDDALRRDLVRRASLGRGTLPRRLPHALSAAVLDFFLQWSALSARLGAARVARTLHLSAAAFALGAMLSLYARGVLSRYGAGWESTFLDAGQVHRLLAALFAPVQQVFGLAGFTLEEVKELRHDSTASLPGSGARWVHLYAGALLLYVVLPRLLLALPAALKAWWLALRFPLDLEQPYYRRLGEAAGGEAGLLRVAPYSFAVDEARGRALEAVAAQLLGEQARLRLLPPVAYGAPLPPLEQGAATLTAALFSLSATPEQENHGAFLTALVRDGGRGVIALLDQSALAPRMDAGRLRERVELWREFCIFHGAEPKVVDLLAPNDGGGSA